MARKRYAKANEVSARWRKNHPEEALLSVARCRAKRKGQEFTITAKEITPFPTTCPVLGQALCQGTSSRHPDAWSIDRVDNSRGYVPGNVKIISLRANMLKSSATLDESTKIAYYQAEHVDWLGLKETADGGR